jgi:molybdopterin/thiamine biosynthesis adenylyltransferase
MMPLLPTTPDMQSRARRAGYDPAVMQRACVLVVGAGALGQNLAQDLALSGVGSIRVVDGDVFEEHNRSRSPLHPRHGTYRVGERLPKASSVAQELARIHVGERATILAADTWIEELGLGAFAGVDVIAGCVDALVARSYLARVALLLDLPIIDGGFSGANLGMTVYPAGGDPHEAPCWSCAGAAAPGAFSCEQYARYAQAEGVVPAIQNGAAALGAMCAEAIVGLLHGREGEPRRVTLDLRTGVSRVFRPRPDPECAARHRRLGEPLPLDLTPQATVAEALAVLGEPDATLLPPDIYVERAHCPVEGCRAACDVGAPMHRWRRDPRCESCGGPWPRADVQIPSPDMIDGGLRGADPRSALTLATLGARAGDVLEVEGGAYAAIRLAGDAAELFTAIEPTPSAVLA